MNEQANKTEDEEEYCPKLNLSGWNPSEKEIKVLLILDRIPFFNMGDIHLFKEVGIDKGELIPILETLIEKGLVSRKGKEK